mgnify:CR=1 FL=1|jgi:hypothetical protein
MTQFRTSRHGMFSTLAFVTLSALAATACSKTTTAPALTPKVAAPATATAAANPRAAKTGAAKAEATPTAKLRLKAVVAGVAADWAAVKAVAAGATPTAPKTPKPAGVAGAKRFPKTTYDSSKAPATAPATGFRLEYAPTKNAEQASFQGAFQKERVFESVVAQLNEKIRIRGVIVVELAPCGEANAFYDDGSDVPEEAEPGDKASAEKHAAATPRIIICYELMSEFLELFAADTKEPKELGAKVAGAVYHTFFHELGHALTDNLKLPIVGREEDAVDQLATLMLLGMGEHGIDAAFSAADAFALEQEDEDESGDTQPMWDEHSMSGQRMYDMLCMIYGSNTEEFADLVSDDGLPQDRAEMCEESYGAILAAWTKLLGPHLIQGTTLGVSLPTAEAVSAAKPPASPARALGAKAGSANIPGSKADSDAEDKGEDDDEGDEGDEK